MEEETLRKMAIAQYLQEKSPASIYQELGRSKYWFFKWLKRYQSGDPEWYRDRSKAPIGILIKLPWRPKPRQEHSRSARSQSLCQVGVSASNAMSRTGRHPAFRQDHQPDPQKEGPHQKKHPIPQRSALPYFRVPLGYNHVHQADLVGPRYIKNDGRFFLSISWIFTAIASFFIPSEPRTIRPLPRA